MITVDNICRDILAKHIRNNSADGKDLRKKHADSIISKKEYLDQLYLLVDKWLDGLHPDEVASLLSKEDYFSYNIKKQMKKITKDNPAACLIEPIIVKRIDPEGNSHFLAVANVESDDILITTLSLHGPLLNEFLTALDVNGYYTCGLNWFHKDNFKASILIFGEEEAAKEMKEQLIKSYDRYR